VTAGTACGAPLLTVPAGVLFLGFGTYFTFEPYFEYVKEYLS